MDFIKFTKDIFKVLSGEKANVDDKENNVEIIYSPMKGKLLDLSAVPDAIFADKLLGDGVALEPEDGIITSPVDGEIVVLFDTLHALAIKTRTGVELLLHIGIDTVELNGEGFTTLVKQGDSVKAGDKLMKIDLEIIKSRAKSVLTPVIVTNLSEFSSYEKSGEKLVNHMDELFRIYLK